MPITIAAMKAPIHWFLNTQLATANVLGLQALESIYVQCTYTICADSA